MKSFQKLLTALIDKPDNPVIAKSPLGIFWDIENCSIPHNKSPSDVAKHIRDHIHVRHPHCGYAKEFFVVADTRRMDPHVCDSLDRNGVVVVHVNGAAKNAADDKLQELMDMFVDKFGAGAVLTVITGDINFSKSILNARRKDLIVVLIYGRNHAQDLKHLANESYFFDDVIRGAHTITKNDKELSPAYLQIMNLPVDIELQDITSRLSRLSANCGGKVESVGGGEAVIRFGCKDDAQRATQRMAGVDCFGHKINVKLIDKIKPKPASAMAQMSNEEINKSIIKGFPFNSGDKVLQIIQSMVNGWSDKQINGNLITNVEIKGKHLVVTAVSGDANHKLIVASERHLRPQSGVKWEVFSDNKHNVNDVKTKRSNEDTTDDKRKSLIKGLFIKSGENPLHLVRQLIMDWKDPQINPNFISYVSRGGKSDGKLTLFVTASSVQNNQLLLSAAKRHLKDSHIKWFKMTPKLKSNNFKPPIEPKNNVKRDLNVGQYDEITCKSVIKGMETKKDDNVSKIVRKLVMSWSDNTLNGNLIVDVKRDVKLAQRDGKALLFVMAVNPKASVALVNGANKYLKPQSGLQWNHYKSKSRPETDGCSGDEDWILVESHSVSHHNIPEAAVSDHNIPEAAVSDDRKSVITGLDITGVNNITEYVQQLVMGWMDPIIDANFITNVEVLAGFESVSAPPLLVTASSPQNCRQLVMASHYFWNQPELSWAFYSH